MQKVKYIKSPSIILETGKSYWIDEIKKTSDGDFVQVYLDEEKTHWLGWMKRDFFESRKYVLFESVSWQMIYCDQDDDKNKLLKNISEAMLYGSDFEKFHSEDYDCVNSQGILSDENIFLLAEGNVRFLWQLGSKVSDMIGNVIPHLYYIRKIGMEIL